MGDMPGDGLTHEEACAAALASLGQMTAARLGALLRAHRPSEALDVLRGVLPASGLAAMVLADGALRTRWARELHPTAELEAAERCRQAGVRVHLLAPVQHQNEPLASSSYPMALATDPAAPPVLFSRGDIALLAGRRVAMVGTRNATRAGRQVAYSIASDLAASGVHVVSGLARGIDGAAHRGALAAEAVGRPVGVVGSGLDIVYPPEHRDLWHAVGNCGLIVSEVPPGEGPLPWRFPQRNRIIAALCEVLVVVESRERGGSLITVSEALARGVQVMAVPGGVGSRASAGTNQLLRDGAAPVLDAGDVLTVLQIDHTRSAPMGELRPRPAAHDVELYRLVGDQPRTIDSLALASGLSLVEVAMRLARLEAGGWVAQADGWFETVGSPLP